MKFLKNNNFLKNLYCQRNSKGKRFQSPSAVKSEPKEKKNSKETARQ